jgi:hypothetical protein
MKFVIELEGRTLLELLELLDLARKNLTEGQPELVHGSALSSVRVRSADGETLGEFRRQYRIAHPAAMKRWQSDPIE